MKRLQHIATVGFCFALLATSTIRSHNQIDDALAKISSEEMKSNKRSLIIKIAKGALGAGAMIGASLIPFIRGTGIDSGLLLGALPVGVACFSDDPALKVAGFSAGAGAVIIGGASGLLVTDPVIDKDGILDRMPLTTFKNIASILRNAKYRKAADGMWVLNPGFKSAAGALGVAGACGVYLGSEAFDSVGKFVGKKQILLEDYLAGRNKEKSR